MAYHMAATAMTLNDLEGQSPVASLFECNSSNIYAAFYTTSTDSVLARFLCISRASSLFKLAGNGCNRVFSFLFFFYVFDYALNCE